ncbi:MAG TPA: transcriptional activator NhaR [Spirochaetia bacterium]|nr:transcriptional activator NhaR [Spirochaetia bacterium]
MEWLNYHHLLYFWHVAREGGLTRACAQLMLAPSTVSKQIHELETTLGHPLFEHRGRRLVLTESGRIAYRYAEELFGLGRELQSTLKDRPVGRPMRFAVGVADVVPKLIAQRVLESVQVREGPVRLVCREDKPDRLIAELALHNLDVVLSDSPAPPHVNVRAFSHLLGEYGVTLFASRNLASRLRPGFPASLNSAPMLLPTENTMLRHTLDEWLQTNDLRPIIVGEFEDSALLMAFGQRGAGVFPAPSPIAREVERQYRVVEIGTIRGARERLYAVSVERRIRHPAVAAISHAARAIMDEREPMGRPAIRKSRPRAR